MGWLRDHALIVSLGVFLVTSIVSMLVIGYLGVVAGIAFLSGQMSVGFLFGLGPYLVVLALLLILTTVSGLSLGWEALRRLSHGLAALRRLPLPRGGRLYDGFERLEERSTVFDALDLSAFVAPREPSEDEKLEALKQQYVEGDINEVEFEREIDRLHTTDSLDKDVYQARESRNTAHE